MNKIDSLAEKKDRGEMEGDKLCVSRIVAFMSYKDGTTQNWGNTDFRFYFQISKF